MLWYALEYSCVLSNIYLIINNCFFIVPCFTLSLSLALLQAYNF